MNFLEKVWTSLMSTDEHQYLHFDTCLASHEKNGIDWKDYALGELTLYLIQINLRTGLEKLGCPDKLVNKETKRAKKSFVRSSNNKSKKNIQGDRQKGLPLMVTYNSFLSHLGQTIRKNLFLLYQGEEVQRVFTPAPFVSIRTARTLRNHLVRTKVYPAEERHV